MTGLYIHIPFCRKRCIYCHFASGWPWSLDKETVYLETLLQEAFLYAEHYGKLPVQTLYLGGGTPSLLSMQGVSQLLHQLSKIFSLELKECTIEVNPEDVSPDKLSLWKSLGFNRISLGVQSLQHEILQFLSRPIIHSDSIYQLVSSAFDNISVDFIIGLPILDTDLILRWIEKYLPSHLSLYLFSVEKGSTIAGLSLLQNFPNIDPDIQADQYLFLAEALSSWYEWYEISNFARNRLCRALHNRLYWNYEPYIGLGISASGFLLWEKKRYRNTFHWHEYQNAIKQGFFPYAERENIDEITERFERFMLGLRTSDGVDMNWIRAWASEPTFYSLEEKIQKLSSFLLHDRDRLILSPEGRMISNTIITELWKILEKEKATERD